MKDLKFSGQYLILIFDFLSRLLKEAETVEINEGQLMVCIPYMLTKTASRDYNSSSSGNRTYGISYWPEAVKYFLRMYATDTAIRKETADLEAIYRNAKETENSYA